MKISVSIKLADNCSEQESVANITIKSLPINNRDLVGKQIETLVWEQFQSALRLYYRVEKDGETFKKVKNDNLE